MTENITADEAREQTHKALAADCDIDPYVTIIDAAIRAAVANGEWTIRPCVVLKAENLVLITCYVAALRRHYIERGFQWREPVTLVRSAIPATPQDVELSWEEETEKRES